MRLFATRDLRQWLEERQERALSELDQFDPEQVVFSPEAVAKQISDRYALEPIGIEWDTLTRLQTRQVKITGSEFGSPYTVDGQSVTLRANLFGPEELFSMQASTRTLGGSPDVEVQAGQVSWEIRARALAREDVERSRDAMRADLDKQCGWVNADTQHWNQALEKVVAARAGRRKQLLDQSAALDAELDIPLSEVSAQDRIIVPVNRKAISVPQQNTGAGQTVKADPAITNAIYEAIVDTIRHVGNAVERLPATAAKFDEEEWRDLLLFILNANFEGGVQGEAFNGNGKTDLLLRHEDRNAFIGECKIWRGSKAFSDAIDQLLGYTVWRDTKAALVLFIRNKDATAIIAKADEAIRQHSCFVSARPATDAVARSDYLMHSKDDAERRISLALLPIVVREPVETDD